MSFFTRSDRLDDRRRRMLTDEKRQRPASTPATDGPEPPARAPRAPRTAASSGAYPKMLESRRVMDLVPRRHSTLLLLFLSGLTVIAGLEALYAWMPRLAHLTTDGRIASFDLDGEGSLGATFSSLILTLSGLTAWLIYTVRRRRQDDYHARYRVWIWVAVCWLVMALDESASLHEGFKELMVVLTGQRIYGDGSFYWVGAYSVVLGAVGARLVLEIRSCPAALVTLALAGAAYLVAVAAHLELVMPRSGARGIMLEEGCEMIGNLLGLAAMALFARHVILDAHGELRQKKRKGSATDAVDAAIRKRKPAEAGSGLTTGAPRTIGATIRASTGDQLRFDRADEPEPAMRRLSKAERRAMRRARRAADSH